MGRGEISQHMKTNTGCEHMETNISLQSRNNIHNFVQATTRFESIQCVDVISIRNNFYTEIDW